MGNSSMFNTSSILIPFPSLLFSSISYKRPSVQVLDTSEIAGFQLLILDLYVLFSSQISIPFLLSFLLQELLLPEFNTLAVMFGKPSSKFIEQKFPYIKSTNSTSTGAGNWGRRKATEMTHGNVRLKYLFNYCYV